MKAENQKKDMEAMFLKLSYFKTGLIFEKAEAFGGS